MRSPYLAPAILLPDDGGLPCPSALLGFLHFPLEAAPASGSGSQSGQFEFAPHKQGYRPGFFCCLALMCFSPEVSTYPFPLLGSAHECTGSQGRWVLNGVLFNVFRLVLVKIWMALV